MLLFVAEDILSFFNYLNFQIFKIRKKDLIKIYFLKTIFLFNIFKFAFRYFFYWKKKIKKMILQCKLLCVQNPTSNFSQIEHLYSSQDDLFASAKNVRSATDF